MEVSNEARAGGAGVQEHVTAVSAAVTFVSARGTEQTVMDGIALNHCNQIFQRFQLMPLVTRTSPWLAHRDVNWTTLDNAQGPCAGSHRHASSIKTVSHSGESGL